MIADRDIPFIALIGFLDGVLGSEMTAYIAGVCDRDVVKEWRIGAEEPSSPLVRERLQVAFDAATALAPTLGEDGIGSWFFGANQFHDGNAPAWVIRHARSSDELVGVVSAARAFTWPA